MLENQFDTLLVSAKISLLCSMPADKRSYKLRFVVCEASFDSFDKIIFLLSIYWEKYE
jgi:hypothetical protein